MNLYYYLDAQRQKCGPVQAHELASLGVTDTTLVWTHGMDNWQPANQVPELAPYLAQPQPLYLPPMGPITRKPRPAIPMEVRPATLTEVKEDNTVDSNTVDSNMADSNMVDNTELPPLPLAKDKCLPCPKTTWYGLFLPQFYAAGLSASMRLCVPPRSVHCIMPAIMTEP